MVQTTTQQGYGAAHQRRRAQDAVMVEAGLARCWRCGRSIVPRKVLRRDGRWVSNWHLGHDDNDRTRYRGPEHERCNVRAGASKGGRVIAARRRRLRTARRLVTSREW